MDQFIEFAGNHPGLHLALVAVLGMLAWTFLGNRIAGYKRIEPTEAVPLLNRENAVLLDIRDNKDFRAGHVSGAVHIPHSALAKRHVELAKDKDKPIIVACRAGTHASTACGLLRKQGFENVYMMSGGMLAWQAANLPTRSKK
jgi:rhodanese-related sulfurtransferase